MAEVDDLCLDNVDEFVNDESKRVTYKWLSQALSMHVNCAKQLLFRFVELQRNKKDNDSLSVTYVLSGITEENGVMAHKVQIVPEEKLEAAKSNFTVLTTCHIYSVQKGPLKDTNTLYMADYESVKQNMQHPNQHSAIQCPWAKVRTDEQMEQFVQVKASQTPVQPPRPVSKQPVAKSSKPAGIAGMFSKAAPKSTKDSKNEQQTTNQSAKESTKESTDNKNKANGKAKQGGVMSFFGKQAAKPKTETESKQEKPKTETEPEKPKEHQSHNTESTAHSKKSPAKRKDDAKSSKTDSKRGVKHKVDSEDEMPKEKKRKRVKVQIESSSEEEDVDMDSPIPSPAGSDPDMIPPSPDRKESPVPREPSPSPKKSPQKSTVAEDNDMCGKVKKRQLVSKTFVNEDGFMVTEKVYENTWEDAPKEEKVTPEKNKDAKNSAATSKSKKTTPTKKVSPNSKNSGKQTSLMSFFKKK